MVRCHRICINPAVSPRWICRAGIVMDTSRGVIYLTGSDGVKRDKTRQISRIRYDAEKRLYLINFEGSDKLFYYKSGNVEIIRSATAEQKSSSVIGYLKEIASLCEIKNDDSENVLAKNYERLEFVHPESALSVYLDPKAHGVKRLGESRPIFPFGCNQSQMQAVRNALENSLSVIQGPPGTGKTQTILNIIANLVVDRKTVLVVSNNNSAIENVKEKLASPKCGLGFMVASLGSVENITGFLGRQSGKYPAELESWLRLEKTDDLHWRASSAFEALNRYFIKQEKDALQRRELAQVVVEFRHFMLSAERLSVARGRVLPSFSSDAIMNLWLGARRRIEEGRGFSLWYRLWLRFKYGIGTWRFWKLTAEKVMRLYKELFYLSRIRELSAGLSDGEMQKIDAIIKDACSLSMAFLRHMVAKRYIGRGSRKIFTAREFARGVGAFYEEYPIALSTTFSSRRCLPYFSRDFLFDYVIIDEASQVDVATGALALSCARNAVVVGDKMQLPNVVTTADRIRASEILQRYSLDAAYDYSRYSLLSSVESLFPDVPQVLLREHYRCHPKIIEFCNQKFYGNRLLVMTKDSREDDVINVYRTNEGNHCRGHVNRRQIDVILKEILPCVRDNPPEEIGIIAPYRDQADEIRAAAPGISASTVHKFQGREKDVIIISTVDDRITPFADDANLLNVAISRAKSKLFVVMSGNEQPKNTNLGDLVAYINYNNFTVTESRVNSVFDYLYSQYSMRRQMYMADARKVSRYDSENLMYKLICDVLRQPGLSSLGVIFEHPLRELLNLRQIDWLTDEERSYALNDLTHIDFLVYNKFSKAPVLAIEVDGHKFHRKGTRQAERDKLKDSILGKCGIRLMRFSTTGSQERERLVSALKPNEVEDGNAG